MKLPLKKNPSYLIPENEKYSLKNITNKSTDWTVNQSTNQTINKTIIQSIHLTGNQQIDVLKMWIDHIIKNPKVTSELTKSNLINQ